MRPMIAVIVSVSLMSCFAPAQDTIGIFESHSDVGAVLHPGTATFDSAKHTYTLTGSGENMWSTQDAFQFAWKKVSGDVELTADISFANSSGNPHKKAVLIFRQSLDEDSAYADVALHSSGLIALQYRDEKGATTQEVQSHVTPVRAMLSPRDSPNEIPSYMPLEVRLRLTRRSNYLYMSIASLGGTIHYDGESIRIPLEGSFYAGIGMCAHDKDAIETAHFSNLNLRSLPPQTGQPVLYSTLEKIAVNSTDRTAIYTAQARFEAPNWSRDGSYLLFNWAGKLLKLMLSGGDPAVLDTYSATHLNNDHGISPDATMLAISDNTAETKSPDGKPAHDSLVYVLPIAGGEPRRLTRNAPSYWHGWSPDGKTLAFVGQRNGEFDIYTIPITGGDETRLTTAKGLDDGPEYSPDGQYVYFNSERTGHMQIWRMKTDGSDQELVFADDYNNWFPHISPDGKWMVFLTYEREVTGHPENKDVILRLMNLNDKKVTLLAKLFGGQGTINVPSWSPDSKSVAFVSYALIPAEDAGGDHK